MITFSCPRCGMKLRVKPEFAGRTSRCPTCKHPLTVPTIDTTQAFLPGDQIDGTPSSVARAGIEEGVTLGRPEPAASGGQRSVEELLAGKAGTGERYVIEGEIARGGMGAVLRAVDRDIRREVAVKYMLDDADQAKKLRFVEEAQITGQLEHPNIVPIHELGVDKDGRLFFSMKMVRGRSLAQVLDQLRQDPQTAEKEWPLGRLLNVLVGVCNGLAYAHSRGVVHRDLKPANVMVGDFGEVYVMDWGLAKVLQGRGPTVPMPGVAAAPAAAVAVPSGGVPAMRTGKVETSRQGEADLTQDGAILGTPAYMPPEQAGGMVNQIDHRSDIYSLGAILYAVLTLQTPVEQAGGYLAVLLRAAEGEVIPPHQRSPQRARAGKIPRELAAVAMKAMAKEPKDRYQRVEELRRDVELYQEGHSVSARQDTLRELLWKLARRNKAASLAGAVVLLVLVGSLAVIAAAWWETDQARLARQKALEEKEDRTRQAVPALVEAAHLAVDNRRLDNALAQLQVALEYDAGRADARLLKGQVLLARQDFAAAETELREYLKLQPQDADARRLAELSGQGQPELPGVLLDCADLLQKQKEYRLAEHLYRLVPHTEEMKVKKKLLEVYRLRIEAAWPGRGERLRLDARGQYQAEFSGCGELTDLGPLTDMPLTWLSLWTCDRVQDLTPLHGMPLTRLFLGHCKQVTDLTPLHGMPLTRLQLTGCRQVRDLSPLQGMPLTWLLLDGCVSIRDLTPLRSMRLIELDLGDCDQLRDLEPLEGLQLERLDVGRCSQVADLRPLKGMPLTDLTLSGCPQVQDLMPLKGMQLTRLNMAGCRKIKDLTPLRGMPLTTLRLDRCDQIQDLTPLQGMPLTGLTLTPRNIRKGLDVLREMKTLKTIDVGDQPKDRLTSEQFWQKYEAGEFGK